MTVENREIEDRVVRYWTVRSHDFGTIRKNELANAMGRRWLEELEAGLPQGALFGSWTLAQAQASLPFSWPGWATG